MKKTKFLLREFYVPILVLFGIVLYLLLSISRLNTIATIIVLIAIFWGSYKLFLETGSSLLKRQFALDYIAILAIIVSLITREYLVASVIALMISSGKTLEDYGVRQAKKSLTKLIDRIPRKITLYKNGEIREGLEIEKIKKGQQIYMRRGEVIGLDGILVTKAALLDESSLTGEAEPVERSEGDTIRSGTVNMGNPIVLTVSREEKDSTYRKIIEMVKKAEGEKSPFIRLAEKYSAIFTLITFVIAGFAYFYSHTLESVLAVLVVATPCPLILATPIALMGGVSSSAKKRIIVKRLASLEALSRVNTFIFDKTGTITLGKPKVVELKILSNKYGEKEILGIAHSIEKHSLHPFAKAIVEYGTLQKTTNYTATEIEEEIGKGISGRIDGKKYTISKKEGAGMSISLKTEGKELAYFILEDEIKSDTKAIVEKLKKIGIDIFIFTGDKKEQAEKVAEKLGGGLTIKAECTPQEKQEGIKELKKQHKTTAMVGDGINDAPALALADVGEVFSNEEQTAASEAADIVFLGNNFSLVLESFLISRRTIKITLQSILAGIGMSVVAMIFASFGLIPPIVGAFLQEAIDVAVILNALRASQEFKSISL